MTDLRNIGPRKAGGCLALFALPFVFAGVITVLIAFGVISARLGGPRWIVGVAGVAFLVPGLAMLGLGLRSIVTATRVPDQTPGLDAVIVTVVLTCLSIVLAGGALFGDPRSFRGRGLTGTTAEARFWFGPAAVVTTGIVVVFWALARPRRVSSAGSAGCPRPHRPGIPRERVRSGSCRPRPIA